MAISDFPNFSELSFADKRQYDELIKAMPPMADISFASIMGWWGIYTPPKVAILNGNIIVNYSLEGDARHSGLSLLGTNCVDETICTLFDYLKEQGGDVRLVHVPECVIDGMRYPELFNFRGERGYDEYIVDLSKFYPLDGASFYQRSRVDSFTQKTAQSYMNVGPLNLSLKENQDKMLDALNTWPKKGVNNVSTRVKDALCNAIVNSESLGLHNVCLLIDGELHSFLFFQAPADAAYVTIEYGKLSYAMPGIFNFVSYAFAEWFVQQGVGHVNMGMDYGNPLLRVAKLALSPVNFFRKYTIGPAYEPSKISALVH